jgi:hypothetical protein
MAEEDKTPKPDDKEPEDKQPEDKQPEEPKGDDKIAALKYREQRDKARTDLADLQKQLEAVKGDSEELTKLKAQVAEQQKALEDEKAAAIVTKAKTVLLAKEGCVDLDAALKLLGDDEDVEDFKKAKPYLFKQVQTGSTGAPPAGATGASDKDKSDYVREKMKLPKKG